jgi:hypothetical protein
MILFDTAINSTLAEHLASAIVPSTFWSSPIAGVRSALMFYAADVRTEGGMRVRSDPPKPRDGGRAVRR